MACFDLSGNIVMCCRCPILGSIERTLIHPFNEVLLTEFLAPFSTAPRWPGQEVHLFLLISPIHNVPPDGTYY